MKYTKLAAVALASVMMLSACGQSANNDNPIVMTVGDTQITESEFNYYMNTYKENYNMGQAKKSSLEYCQRNQLIVEVAKAMDIKIDSDTQSKLKDYQKSIKDSYDRDQIIAVAGGGKRELLGKTISRQLEEMIINRENSIQAGLDKKTIPLISGDEDSYSAQAIYPICCEGDCIGAVILYSRENQTHFSETEYKAAACAASFLGKQMEG